MWTMSVIMWKVAIWVLQFPAEPYALHAVCIFSRILLAVQRSRCRAIVECEASVPLPAGTTEIQEIQACLFLRVPQVPVGTTEILVFC